MSPTTHKAIGLISLSTIGEFDVPTRHPKPHEVRLKVEHAALSAADGHNIHSGYHVPQYPSQIGLVATGEVVEVGSEVTGFQKGDIVGAFTQPDADRAIQEYVIAPYDRVTKIPEGVSQVDVAAIIDNFTCAWWTITNSFGLPLPESIPSTQALDPAIASEPILLWGGGTGSSIYALQVLRLAGYTNLITTTSPHTAAAAKEFGGEQVKVFDYNDPDVVQKIKDAAVGRPIKYALDPVCTQTSLNKLSEIVAPGGKVAVLIPIKAGNLTNLGDRGAELFSDLPERLNPLKPKGIEAVPTYTFRWESNAALKENLLNKILPELLKSGEIKAQATHVITEGDFVQRVQAAADCLLGNKVRGKKIIVSLK